VNEYSELLGYLERNKKETPLKESIKKIEPIVEKINNSSNLLNNIDKLDEYLILKEEPIKNAVNLNSKFDVKLFEDIIKKKIVEKKETSRLYDRPHITVGELLQCDRQVYFERKKYDYDSEKLTLYPNVDFMGYIGNYIHTYIQNIYPFDETEKSVHCKKYQVKGRVDAILNNILFEIKPIDSLYRDELKNKDFNQANIYTYILNTEYDYKIDTIVILYAYRNLKTFIPFDVKPDINEAIKYLKKSVEIQKFLNINKLPDYNSFYDDQCKFCIYEKPCMKDRSIKNDTKNIFLL